MGKIKKFKPMLCPICEGFYFSKPSKDNYEEELQEYISGEVQCRHCGWIYELEQVRNPETYIGYNKVTLIEYKKEYEEKIKENPDYDYLNENMPDPVPHMCPVCGKYEIEDYGYSEICPYCGWEDDAFQEEEPDDPRGANGMSLNDYRKEYEEKIKENPNYVWENEFDD
jgi:hypothetical protein